MQRSWLFVDQMPSLCEQVAKSQYRRFALVPGQIIVTMAAVAGLQRAHAPSIVLCRKTEGCGWQALLGLSLAHRAGVDLCVS